MITLNVGYASQKSDWNWKNVRSPFARVYLVTDGEADVTFNQVTTHLTPGHLYFIPPYTTHSYHCNGKFCHYYVHIYEDTDYDTSLLENWDMPREVKAVVADEKMMNRLCHILPFLKLPESDPDTYDNHQTLMKNLQLYQNCPPYKKLEAQGIAMILLSRFLMTAKPIDHVSNSRIQQALLYLRRHISEPVGLNEMAESACMSKDYFSRIFKQEMGMAPNTYITMKKMEKAELRLITTDDPIKNIAEDLGYEDYSYFNRIFKKQTGLTPQQYRVNTKEKTESDC